MDLSNDLVAKLKNELPAKIANNLSIIERVTLEINSFDLIAIISLYNGSQDMKEYTDDRGDRNFFIAEAIAIQCLKNTFVEESTLELEEIATTIEELQKATHEYCWMNETLQGILSGHLSQDSVLDNIVHKIESEAKSVRNPGLPKHHLNFSKKLFFPLNSNIEKIFGFNLEDSIVIRDKICDFLNFRYQNEVESNKDKGKKCAKEIILFKNGKINKEEIEFEIEELDEILPLSDNEIRKLCKNYFESTLTLSLGNTLSFTANELADYLQLDKNNVENYLNTFSCTFGEVGSDTSIYQALSILKKQPIIKHNDRYIIPSIPLFVWSTEEVFEKEFLKNNKTYGKYITRRHDFLLDEGVEYFKSLLPSAIIGTNLFYKIGENRYETDGLMLYQKTLFIIEAKGNKISEKAKSGHKLKTKDHLEAIFKDSYEQGIRTLKYLEGDEIVNFYDKRNKVFEIDFSSIEEVKIISLTYEPIGNIVPILKKDNDLNYFTKDSFPWILSIYDLVVIKDLFETPSVFMHYIRMREDFLKHPNIMIYEELDIIGLFLKGRLYLDNFMEQAKQDGVDKVFFQTETDFINDFYMKKFKNPDRFHLKPSFFKDNDFKNFIASIDKSNLPNIIKISSILLRLNIPSINNLMSKIKSCKKMFNNDKQLHHCTFHIGSPLSFGFTYMISKTESEISNVMEKYCKTKKHELNCKIWIGVGEVNSKIIITFFEEA